MCGSEYRKARVDVEIRQEESATTIQGKEDIQTTAVVVKVIRSVGGFCIQSVGKAKRIS